MRTHVLVFSPFGRYVRSLVRNFDFANNNFVFGWDGIALSFFIYIGVLLSLDEVNLHPLYR